MKKAIAMLFGIALVVAGIYAGCGGASAPPIDLPAPITGRIDVSPPDSDGNVSVTGNEGAVTGGYIVMVAKGEEAAAFFISPLDLVVPSAHAADMPEVCDEEGHECAYSEEDGSFDIVIGAEAEETLTIGLIHADSGAWRSPTITVTVPKPDEPEADCAGLGLDGAVVDVAVAPTTGAPILLKQGSDSTTNTLVIGDDETAEFEISGCHAHSIAANKMQTGDLIVVTSRDDKTIWAGILSEGEIKGARSFEILGEPMHAAFAGPIMAPLIAVREEDTVALKQMSLIDGKVLESMNVLWPTPVTGLTRSLGIDVIAMGNNQNEHLGLLLTDKGDNVQAYITVFQADNATHKRTERRVDAAGTSGDLQSVVSGALSVHQQTESVRLAAADSASEANSIVQLIISVTVDSQDGELGIGVDLDAVESWNMIMIVPQNQYAVTEYDVEEVGRLRQMKRSADDSGIDCAVVVTDTGRLVKQQLVTSPDQESSWNIWEGGNNIVAIDLDDTLKKLFGADATAGAAIDGSDIIY